MHEYHKTNENNWEKKLIIGFHWQGHVFWPAIRELAHIHRFNHYNHTCTWKWLKWHGLEILSHIAIILKRHKKRTTKIVHIIVACPCEAICFFLGQERERRPESIGWVQMFQLSTIVHCYSYHQSSERINYNVIMINVFWYSRWSSNASTHFIINCFFRYRVCYIAYCLNVWFAFHDGSPSQQKSFPNESNIYTMCSIHAESANKKRDPDTSRRDPT